MNYNLVFETVFFEKVEIAWENSIKTVYDHYGCQYLKSSLVLTYGTWPRKLINKTRASRTNVTAT